MNPELHTVEVDLRRLVEILGDHLYSSPTVALREIVQNAHDAIERRCVEDRSAFTPRIHVRTDSNRGRISIEDNGAGLTREEILRYVATIGSGYTRMLRSQSAESELIGYFGLGFLTAHVISSHVELHTTSHQEPEAGWRFIGRGPTRFYLEAAERRPIGTLLSLKLTREYRDFAVPEITRDLIAHYCRLLPIPVYLDEDPEPVNKLCPPWSEEHSNAPPIRLARLRLEYAALFERRFTPLCTIPIASNGEGSLSGLIWIQGGATYGSTDNRNVSVFVRGMFITGEERELLPYWAGFAGAVVASKQLLPTLSREGLQRNADYRAVADHLRQTLIDGLAEIAASQPHTFRQILRFHNEALRGAALDDDRLFDLLAEDLKVPTSEGEMTLSRVRDRCEGDLIVSLGEKSGFEEVLFNARMKPVINGYRFAVLPFCRRYCEAHPGQLHVIGTEQGNEAIFPPETMSADQKSVIERLFRHLHYALIATRFQPDYLPLALIPDREYALKKRIEADEADRRISRGALHLARLYTGTIEQKEPARLYLNLESPLIQRLLQAPEGKSRSAAAILSSFVHILSSHHSPDFPIDTAAEFRSLNEQIQQLLEL